MAPTNLTTDSSKYEGAITITAYSVYDDTNKSTAATASNNYFDVTGPTISAITLKKDTTAVSEKNWVNKDVNITVSASDNLSGFKQWTISGSGVATTGNTKQASESYTYGTEGKNVLTVTPADNLGNTGTAKTTEVWIDKTPPTVTSVNATSDAPDSIKVTVAGNDNKNGVADTSGIKEYTIKVTDPSGAQVGTATATPSALTQTISGLKPKTNYKVEVTATDNANNTSTVTTQSTKSNVTTKLTLGTPKISVAPKEGTTGYIENGIGYLNNTVIITVTDAEKGSNAKTMEITVVGTGTGIKTYTQSKSVTSSRKWAYSKL